MMKALPQPVPAEPAIPERPLWREVIAQAIRDVRSSHRDHAVNARYWLLESPDFLTVAALAGSSDPEGLRGQIRARITALESARVSGHRLGWDESKRKFMEQLLKGAA